MAALGRLAKAAGGNKKATIGAMSLMAIPAMAGVYSAHPLQPVSEAVQQELLGDPNAISKAGRAYVSTSMGDIWATEKQQAAMDRLRISQQSIGIGPGPSGQIVFGMYNSRLGGP